MKKLVAALALALLCCGAVAAQGNGNTNGNAYGQGATMPQAQVVRILRAAQPYFESQFGTSLGELIQAYRSGACTIELVATNPPTQTYRISFGGGILIVVMEDDA